MSALQIDLQTGDFLLTNNAFTFVDGDEETQQLLYQTLWSFQGEWFLNLTSGIPYLQEIFIKNPIQAEAILKAAILSVPGIDSLVSFSLTVNPVNRVSSLQVTTKGTSGNLIPAQLLLQAVAA